MRRHDSLIPLTHDHHHAVEHVRVHMLVGLLRSDLDSGRAPRPDLMTRVATLLEQHIRTEEKVLFPMIQEVVPAGLLDAIRLSPRDRSTPGTG